MGGGGGRGGAWDGKGARERRGRKRKERSSRARDSSQGSKRSSTLSCSSPQITLLRTPDRASLPSSHVQILSHLSGTSSNNISLKRLPQYPTQKERWARARVWAVGKNRKRLWQAERLRG